MADWPMVAYDVFRSSESQESCDQAMTLSNTTYHYKVEKGIARITLNRPDRLNAITFTMYEELRDRFHALRRDDAVRVVVITGEGRGFCAGGDREEIIARLFERDAGGIEQFTRMSCDLVAAMRACPRPIVARINGACVGAGAMIALASDYRIAVPDAKFGFVFTKVGLSGADMGATFLLPAVVGMTAATDLLMTGRIFDADEAYRIGFLNAIVSADELDEVVNNKVLELVTGPPFGIGITKMLLNNNMGATLGQALEAETQGQALCMMHPDFQEAYRALKEKRPPKFN
jgi:enoyl-CoA hydratase/carnithine racemase